MVAGRMYVETYWVIAAATMCLHHAPKPRSISSATALKEILKALG